MELRRSDMTVAAGGGAGAGLPAPSPHAPAPAGAGAGTPASAGGGGGRTLTVADVARQAGKTERAVRRWTEPDGPGGGEPCPHDRVTVGKRPELRLSLAEVEAWCRRHGIGWPDRSTPVMFTPAGEVVTAAAKSPPGSPAPPADPLAGVPVGEERRGFRETLARARGMVSTISAAIDAGRLEAISVQELNKLTDTLAKASSEIRLLDDAELKLRKSRGELVPAAGAVAALEAFAQSFTMGLERAGVELGPELKRELADAGCLTPEAAADGERVERVVRAAVKRAGDKLRARLAAEARAQQARSSGDDAGASGRAA